MRTRFTRITQAIIGLIQEDVMSGKVAQERVEEITRRILVIADERAFWGCAEIQTYTGRSKAVVQNWHRRGQADFPSPHQVLAMGPLWDREQIKLWALEHQEIMTNGSPALKEAGWDGL